MLKKLRLKFILISMISVFFVLAITIGAINISNYAVVENNAKTTLVEIIKKGTKDDGPPPPRADEPERPEEPNDALREARYFITIFNEDGTIKDKNCSRMFMVAESECDKLSMKVFKNEIKGTKYEFYRINKTINKDKTISIAFLDIKKELESAGKFLTLSSTISVGAYLALFGLILLASHIAFKPAEEASRKQKKFITNASHELKTPLTVISADLDLIEMDHGKSEWSDSIRNQVQKLTEMTKQLVDLSRLQEDEPTNYPFENFSLSDLCKEVTESFVPSFKKENIKFETAIDDNVKLYGNKYLIDKLLYIFLDNATKYTGGEEKKSRFELSLNSKNKVELKFSNSLDKDEELDPNQMMERFYRSPSNKKEGSGIGLSIAEEIIKLHSGKIKINKFQNELTFVIIFN